MNGVQFYLGMFDTEEAASRAYMKKATEERGNKSSLDHPISALGTGFDFSVLNAIRHDAINANYGNINFNTFNDPRNDQHIADDYNHNNDYGADGNSTGNKRLKPNSPAEVYDQRHVKFSAEVNDSNSNSNSNNDGLTSLEQKRNIDCVSTTRNMRIIWDRHCQIAQRLLLARAAFAKLSELQIVQGEGDPEKVKLLKALEDEVKLLGLVKAQLEECVSRCCLMGLDFNYSTPSTSAAPSVPTVPTLPTVLSSYTHNSNNNISYNNISKYVYNNNFSLRRANKMKSKMNKEKKQAVAAAKRRKRMLMD